MQQYFTFKVKSNLISYSLNDSRLDLIIIRLISEKNQIECKKLGNLLKIAKDSQLIQTK